MRSDAITTLCAVVNSRITLTGAQPTAGDLGEYRYLICSNMDNCYNRPDMIEQIPDCQLHVRHTDIA